MDAVIAKTTPLIEIKSPLLQRKSVRVLLKLDFKRDLYIQGNKWHKLKLNLKEAKRQNKRLLLTFGGAFSNHIAAIAEAAKRENFNAIGMIRGEELANQLDRWSPTLKKASANGMQFNFLSRERYRERNQADFLDKLQLQYPDAYLIPEGGTNQLAVQGFETLMLEINRQAPEWTHLYTAVGTGGTLAGLTAYSHVGLEKTTARPKQVIGVAVLKQADYLKKSIEHWVSATEAPSTHRAQWQLLNEFHHGGYAKTSSELIEFMTRFETEFEVPLDPVYTSKAFYAFYQQLEQDLIPKGSTVILYHSGGLQGRSDPLLN